MLNKKTSTLHPSPKGKGFTAHFNKARNTDVIAIDAKTLQTLTAKDIAEMVKDKKSTPNWRKRMDNWIDFNDKKPPDDKPFLACKESIYWVCEYYIRGHPIHGDSGYQSVICDCCEEIGHGSFTHWMEIPECKEILN